METKSNPPSTIQTADKSPTVIPLFVGVVACDGCDSTRDTVAVGDDDAATYGVNAVEGERVADHIGDELMGDQDTEALLVLDKDGDGMLEGLMVCDDPIVVKAVEE